MSYRAAIFSANPDGVTSESTTTRPSAFETIFWVTTTTSPASMEAPPFAAAWATIAPTSSPSWTSGSPSTPKMRSSGTGMARA